MGEYTVERRSEGCDFVFSAGYNMCVPSDDRVAGGLEEQLVTTRAHKNSAVSLTVRTTCPCEDKYVIN